MGILQLDRGSTRRWYDISVLCVPVCRSSIPTMEAVGNWNFNVLFSVLPRCSPKQTLRSIPSRRVFSHLRVRGRDGHGESFVCTALTSLTCPSLAGGVGKADPNATHAHFQTTTFRLETATAVRPHPQKQSMGLVTRLSPSTSASESQTWRYGFAIC